jgi:hypothetical protein
LRRPALACGVRRYIQQSAGGENAVYFGTKQRGASNARAKKVLGFGPRRLEWLA